MCQALAALMCRHMTDDDHDMPLVPFDAQGLTASGELSAGELKATVRSAVSH